MNQARILIVEDEIIIAMEIQSNLQNFGYEVVGIVDTGADALRMTEETKPDLILMDIRIKGDMDGIEAAEIIRSRYHIPVVFSTAYVDQQRLERARISLPFGYVLKPIHEKDLKVTLEMALYVAKIDNKRREVEETLRRSEKRLTTHIELTPMGVIELDDSYVITSWNPGAEKIFGYAAETAIGRNMMDILVPQHLHNIVKRLWHGGHGKASVNQNETLTRDGRTIICEWFNTPMLDEAGNFTGLTSVCHDITDRLKVEADLRESERRYRQLFENVREGIYVAQDGKLVFMNPMIGEMVGYTVEEISTRPFTDFIHPDDRKMVIDRHILRMRGEELPPRYSFRIIRRDGSISWVELNVVRIEWEGRPATLNFLHDTTDRKCAEELTVQSEKMASISNLAAGMAHELNTPLNTIQRGVQSAVSLLTTEAEPNRILAAEIGLDLDKMELYLEKSGVYSLLAGISEAGENASAIIACLLQLSRRDNAEKAPTDISELIAEALAQTRTDDDLKEIIDQKNLHIETTIQPGMPLVPCDRAEMRQVFLKLLSNAVRALSEGCSDDVCRISIRAFADGDLAQVEVEDNGPGMDDQTKKRVFEPYFTTRPEKNRAGLGLSVSYMAVVYHHQGKLELESEIGSGTRFVIKLPLKAKPS